MFVSGEQRVLPFPLTVYEDREGPDYMKEHVKEEAANAFVGKRHCWNTRNGKARTNIDLRDAVCAMGVEDKS